MKQIMLFMFMPPPQIEVFVQTEREKKLAFFLETVFFSPIRP